MERKLVHSWFSAETVRGSEWHSWLSCVEYIPSTGKRLLVFINRRLSWLTQCQSWEVSSFTYWKIRLSLDFSHFLHSSSFLCSLNPLLRWDDVWGTRMGNFQTKPDDSTASFTEGRDWVKLTSAYLRLVWLPSHLSFFSGFLMPSGKTLTCLKSQTLNHQEVFLPLS